LAPIGEVQRRSENELWRGFEIARPRILGALLDAVVHGLRTLRRVHLEAAADDADGADANAAFSVGELGISLAARWIRTSRSLFESAHRALALRSPQH